MTLRDTGRARVILGLAGLAGVLVLGVALIGLNVSPEIVLAVLATGIAIPCLVLRPDIGVQLFIFTIYIENAVYADRSATLIKFSGALILAGWFLSVAVNRKLNLKFGAVVVMMLTFLAWNAVTIIYCYDADLAVTQVLTFVQLAVAMCMVASVIDSAEKIRGVFRAIVLWTTLASAHGMALYFFGLRETSAGVVLNRNVMANYIDIAIVCAYILYQLSPSVGERVWLLVALPTLFLGLALTFSRTGFITLVVVFFLVSYRLAKSRGYLVLGATVGMLVVISAVLPEAFYRRMASIVPSMRHQEETFGIRVELWKAGVKMVRDHPIVGVGPGNFRRILAKYGEGALLTRHQLISHNSYVGIAAESGIPALLIYLILCVAALREAGLAARARTPASQVISLQGLAVELCIVVLLIAGLSGNPERQKYLYIFFGMAMSVRRLAEQTMRHDQSHIVYHEVGIGGRGSLESSPAS